VIVGFVTAAEYRQNHPTPEAYGISLYRDLLGRDPTSPELTNITTALGQPNAAPVQIARTLLTSHARNVLLVEAYYQEYLDRAPDAPSLATWTAQLDQNSLGEAGLALALLTTFEFYSTAH
jgi:hypothetical protein